MITSVYREQISFKLVLLVGTAFLAGYSSTATAAEAPAAAAPEAADLPAAGADNVIVVTGARTGTTEFKSASPITVETAEKLTANGQPDLRTALGEVNPSFIASNTSNGSSSSKPVRAALLRELSGFHTLVLVDGVRRHNTALLNNTGGTTGAPADLSFIPLEAVDHIEILSDGAAAQYGSDAIAGVVNIILKKGRNGGSAYAQAGLYDTEIAHQGGNGGRGFTTIAGGSQGFTIGHNGGFFNIAGDYRHMDDSDYQGPVGAPVASVAISHIYAYNGVTADPREYTTSRYRQIWEVTPFGYAYDILANGELPITPDITLYANGTYGQNSLTSSGSYRGENNNASVVGFVPEGGYTPFLTTKQKDWQWTVGLKGQNLLGFKWDTNFSDSFNRGDMYVNGINSSYLGTHPYHNIYIGRLQLGQQTVDLNLTREIDVGWGFRPIQFAAGAEYRRETYLEGAGEPDSYSQGPYATFPADYPSASLRGSATYPSSPFMTGFNPVPLGTLPAETGKWARHSFAGYLDISQDITRRLHLGIAGRFESYSDFGSRVAGKFSARYEFIDGFAIRGTINNGFRAPSLAEQFTTVVNTGPGLKQLTDGSYISFPSHGFNSLRLDSPYAVAVGAQPLKPETSLNFSAGFVAKPAPNLDISVDAYQIRIDNRISLTGTYTARNSNGASSPTSSLGGFVVPGTAVVAGLLSDAGLDPTYNVQYFANIGTTRSRGVEGKINYRLDTGGAGVFAFNFSFAYNQQKVRKVNPNPVPALAALGVGLLQLGGKFGIENTYPQWVLKGSLDWTRGPFNIHLLENYYSTTDTPSTQYLGQSQYDTRQPGRAITDLVISVTTPTQSRIKFSLGANNLLNVRAANSPLTPPYGALYGANSGQFTTYPAPVATAWGTGGRFIYARVGVTW